jgi:hypothetical protein
MIRPTIRFSLRQLQYFSHEENQGKYYKGKDEGRGNFAEEITVENGFHPKHDT